MPPAETQFGKYRLLAKIAAGGMAIAYRAELAGAAGVRKRVVLKVIHPHLAQEKNFIQMFISEAKVAASLTHGNIAQVFDFGQIDGRYYLSMEEVIGQPLMRVLKFSRDKGFSRLPVPLALQIAIGVLDGLHYAHTRKDENGAALNLVHRDVTPDNVLISYEGEVKVVDFGIAKTTYSVDQTAAGMVRGKYPYLSPEQAAGHRDLDLRTDIWAAGVQLYDMLCGRRPYEGEFLPVMKDIVSTVPVPSMRQYAPGLDAELEGIVMGSLKKPRAERYATAREFSLALTNYLHQKYPASTRQDVQFLLGTLFPAEAAKEGSDAVVPPGFTQTLHDAARGPVSRDKPGPPVPTEPPSQAQVTGAPRITATSTDAVRALGGGADESTSSGIEIDVEVSGKQSKAQLTDEEPTVHTRLPIDVPPPQLPPPQSKPKNTSERTGLSNKKKGESRRGLKTIDSSPPRKVVVPDARATPPEAPSNAPTHDEFPTQSAALDKNTPGSTDPGTDSGSTPMPKRDTQDLARYVEKIEETGTRKRPRRSGSKVGLWLGLVLVLGGGGFWAWRTLTALSEVPANGTAPAWVTSSPPGATFKVDGIASGKTPGTANLTSGEHTVVVELVGYAPWSRKVTAVANEALNVPATLELVGTAGTAEADGGAAQVAPPGPGPGIGEPPAPEKPAAGVANDESHLIKFPTRTATMRVARMGLPLDSYQPLRIELNPRQAVQIQTQGQVGLGPGRTTSTLFYFLELEGPAAQQGQPAPQHFGLLTSTPKRIANAKAIRVFALDDDTDDNTGAMKVVINLGQYVAPKAVTFDSMKHVIVPKPEQMFRIEGLNENAQYLISSRADQPVLNKRPDGAIGQVLCISQSSKPRPLSRSAKLISAGAKVTLDESSGLECFIPDDTLEDSGGSIELELLDASKAQAEGLNPKNFLAPGKW